MTKSGQGKYHILLLDCESTIMTNQPHTPHPGWSNLFNQLDPQLAKVQLGWSRWSNWAGLKHPLHSLPSGLVSKTLIQLTGNFSANQII